MFQNKPSEEQIRQFQQQMMEKMEKQKRENLEKNKQTSLLMPVDDDELD